MLVDTIQNVEEKVLPSQWGSAMRRATNGVCGNK